MEWEMPYEAEELLPVFQKLARRYTSNESSSVSYDRAQVLMEAVVYCIREYFCEEEASLDCFGMEGEENGFYLQGTALPPVETAYEEGLKKVKEKAKKAKLCYDRVLEHFSDYGMECLSDTVVKGMPAFFLYYDPWYEPQNHRLTLDYPILGGIGERTGVDAIFCYLKAIEIEQSFLEKVGEEYVREVLNCWSEHCFGKGFGYRGQFCNVAQLVLRNLFGSFLVEKPVSEPGFSKEQLLEISDILLPRGDARGNRKTETIAYAKRLFRAFLQRFGMDEAACVYFLKDVEDFMAEVENASSNNRLSVIFVR